MHADGMNALDTSHAKSTGNRAESEPRSREPITVGVDGSDASIEALRRAARISSALDRPLRVATVWQYPLMFGTYVPDVNWSPEDDAHAILDAAIDDAFEIEPPRDLVRAVLRGTPAKVLIEESRHAEMLVLGSRGHGGFAGLLLGSVSAACAERAHCPVLIIHDDGTQASTITSST